MVAVGSIVRAFRLAGLVDEATPLLGARLRSRDGLPCRIDVRPRRRRLGGPRCGLRPGLRRPTLPVMRAGWSVCVYVSALAEKMKTSLFLVPMVSVVAAIVFEQMSVYVDSRLDRGSADLAFGLSSTVDSARAVLTTIAGAACHRIRRHWRLAACDRYWPGFRGPCLRSRHFPSPAICRCCTAPGTWPALNSATRRETSRRVPGDASRRATLGNYAGDHPRCATRVLTAIFVASRSKLARLASARSTQTVTPQPSPVERGVQLRPHRRGGRRTETPSRRRRSHQPTIVQSRRCRR